MSLGTASATDPDGDALRYTLVGGHESGLFTIDKSSGEVFYAGSGEDFESVTGPYELTVRASDGTHTIDATVTVTVTAEAEAPVFAESSYEFTLAENVDGNGTRISLGTVSAADPDGATVGYTLVGGNESGLFAIDEASGEVFYAGPGEDHESVPSHELTVRASDGTSTTDTTVTVTVTDTPEAPSFAQASYEFTLAENAVGNGTRVSLGTVSATDPDGATVGYSLAGGNESGRFTIDASSGELFYIGPGEDHESVPSHALTVRASDGTRTKDTAVTVAVTDVRGDSEAPGEDLPNGRPTSGLVLVDEGAVTGNIEEPGDVDWFAVQLVAGRTYRIDVRGQPTGDGTLVDAHLHGVYDGDGGLIGGTTNFDGGTSHNSRLVFTAPGEGTYYIAASGGNGTQAYGTGTYELEVRDVRAPVFAESGYRFALSENAEGSVERLSLGTVEATDPDGATVRYSLVGGNDSGLFAIDETSGEFYYVGGGEDYESGVTSHELTVRANDGTGSTDATVTVAITNEAEPPAFAEESYAFALAENTDGSVNRLSLGVVEATDPDGGAVRYSLSGGNDSGSFAIDETSGELFYVGSGEDYESDTGLYELTVRASDAAHAVDTTVTVTVTDEAEAPLFAEESYAFALAENTDGSVNRISLGTVQATDPDGGDTLRYSLIGGNESGLFAIDEVSGELSYIGPGEDYESDITSYELTARVSAGTHTIDTTVTITVTDVRGIEEPAEEDLPADTTTKGVVVVDEDPVTGTLRSPTDRDWFEVTMAPERTYRFSVERESDGGGPEPEILGFRDSDGNPIPGTGGGSEVEFTTDPNASDTVYYVEVGGKSDQGPRGARGLGVRSIEIVPRSDSNEGTRYSVRSDDVTDIAADDSTEGEVAVDSSVSSTIDTPGDVDWFAVELVGGQSYRLHLNGADSDDGTLVNPDLLGVHDSDGNLIPGTSDRNHGIDRNSFVRNFTPSESGTYYVAAGGAYGHTGTYTLFVFEYAESSTPPTAPTTAVAVGSSADGNITSVDERQWFTVDLEEGTTYQIDVKGSDTGDGTLRNPVIRIYDPRLNFMGLQDDDGGVGRNSRVALTAAESGTFYVSVGHYEYGRSIPRLGTYEVSITEYSGSVFEASLVLAGTIEVGESATGDIRRWYDVEWFKVELQEGRGYRIDVKGSYTRDGTHPDPYLGGIYDSHGRLVAGTSDMDSGVGPNARAGFIASETGAYYVKVDNMGNVGTYTVAVSEFVDLAASTDTTGEVAVGGSVDGMVDFRGDHDWFEVELVANQIYRITLAARSTGTGTLIQPDLLGVRNSSGELIDGTADDDRRADTHNSLVFFTPTADGTYYVVAGAKSWVVAGTQNHVGGYQLSVTESSTTQRPDDFAASTDTTGTVPVNGSTAGTIDYSGDRDWFAVDLVPGLYRIDMEGRWNFHGTLADPYLYGIHDADGKLIPGTADDNGGFTLHSRVQFTATQAGRYYIVAGADNDVFANDQGTYTLSVEEVM